MALETAGFGSGFSRNTQPYLRCAQDKIEEACGVFGIYAPGEDLSRVSTYALLALQHRGQESAGIAISDGGSIHLKKGNGLVSEVFSHNPELEGIPAVSAIGHVRYSTAGGGFTENAQPLLISYRHGQLAVAHNGNLVNADELRGRLEKEGSIFQTTTDSELVMHLVARCGYRDLRTSLEAVLPVLRGAYSFVFLTEDSLVGVRDPFGVRPLSLGSWNGYYVLASETCAFDTIGAEIIRDVNPGEMVVINKNGLEGKQILPSSRVALCIFEYIYFSRPDSNIQGRNVHLVRKKLGRQLAREQPVSADIITGVPDSSLAAAAGYAEEMGLPYEMGLIKNRYIGRTFIQSGQEIRSLGVQLKLNPVQKLVQGKRVVIVDDSIVRGTTSKKLVNMFFKAGAKEVHLRISSSPVIAPCYYGIDISTYEELIASKRELEEIRREIGATSLGYLSRQGMLDSVELPEEDLCLACFSGKYPI
ncbi:MAG TPA: amidophosphoribosyltransferase [Firmicutes bacterium]|nr:amidophosphoribosyltransferase [Bacillota bacterium]